MTTKSFSFLAIYLLFFSTLVFENSLRAQNFSAQEIQDFKNRARRVDIIRDNWGVPHVYGKTDADAVFGLMYVLCHVFVVACRPLCRTLARADV